MAWRLTPWSHFLIVISSSDVKSSFNSGKNASHAVAVEYIYSSGSINPKRILVILVPYTYYLLDFLKFSTRVLCKTSILLRQRWTDLRQPHAQFMPAQSLPPPLVSLSFLPDFSESDEG